MALNEPSLVACKMEEDGVKLQGNTSDNAKAIAARIAITSSSKRHHQVLENQVEDHTTTSEKVLSSSIPLNELLKKSAHESQDQGNCFSTGLNR